MTFESQSSESKEVTSNVDPLAQFNQVPADRGCGFHLGLVAAVIVTCGLLLGGAGYQYWELTYGTSKPAPVLIEIKTVDGQGQPVSGATVASDGQTLGVTDSFGEWRKFAWRDQGSTVAIVLSKAFSHDRRIVATKNIAIPFVRGQKQITISRTIELSDPKVRADETFVTEDKESAVDVATLERKPEVAKAVLLESQVPHNVTARSEVVAVSPANADWEDVDHVRANYVKEKIATEMRQLVEASDDDAVRSDLRVIQLSHLAVKGENGLLWISGKLLDNEFTMLRNYLPGPRRTAEAVLRGVGEWSRSRHGELAWEPGMDRLSLKVIGADLRKDQLYISGFPVTVKDSRSAMSWAKDGSMVVATLVSGSRVVHRERFRFRQGQVKTLAVGALNVARRD